MQGTAGGTRRGSASLVVDLRDRTARLERRLEPGPPDPGEVLLESLEVGLCGTDREILAGLHGQAPAHESSLVLGHECLARVAAVGAGVHDLSHGDLVVPVVRLACTSRSCSPCRNLQSDFCETGTFVERGIRGAHGYLRRQALERRDDVVLVPAELRDIGVLVEPLTVAQKALRQLPALRSRLPWGEPRDVPVRALVVGAGPVGLLAAFAFGLRGWAVTVASRSAPDSPKAALARRAGAHYRCVAQTRVDRGGDDSERFDVVFEASGNPDAVLGAVLALAPNGVLITTGLPEGATKPAAAAESLRALVLGNQMLVGSVNASRADYRAAVDDLSEMHRRWPGLVDDLVTLRVPLEEAQAVVHDRPLIKTVIVVHDERLGGAR